MNTHTEDDELTQAIENTRADGHAIETDLKASQRSLGLAGRKLHNAVARQAEYQSAQVTHNTSLLREIDTRHAYYLSLRRDIDAVIDENRRQRHIVAAALRGAIAGNAALEADMLRGPGDE